MSEPAGRKRGLPVRVKMRHEAHFVEELASRHVEPVGEMVPLSAIEPDAEQPRTSMGDLTDLVASIRDKGVLEPILVRPNPDGATDSSAAEYRIISGERRFRAAKEAGLFDVPVIRMEVSEEEALEIALIENLQRKDLTPFEEAEGYRALGDRHGYTHEQIASAVGKARSGVTEGLKLLEMPPRARDAAMALGIGSKTALLEALKASGGDEEALIQLLERLASGQLTREELRETKRKTTRGAGGQRSKPYVFRFRPPDKSFQLNLSFKKSEVERTDLIAALEKILGDLRKAEKEEEG